MLLKQILSVWMQPNLIHLHQSHCTLQVACGWSIKLVGCFIRCTLVDVALRHTTDLHACVNIPVTFHPRLTSTRVTWAGWQVSFLEGIITWSRWNWKVQRTPWGCARWRSSVGKKARASRFWDRSQPVWPSKRTVKLRLSECFASSPHRSVLLLLPYAL